LPDVEVEELLDLVLVPDADRLLGRRRRHKEVVDAGRARALRDSRGLVDRLEGLAGGDVDRLEEGTEAGDQLLLSETKVEVQDGEDLTLHQVDLRRREMRRITHPVLVKRRRV
jgi:hypothetical protein